MYAQMAYSDGSVMDLFPTGSGLERIILPGSDEAAGIPLVSERNETISIRPRSYIDLVTVELPAYTPPEILHYDSSIVSIALADSNGTLESETPRPLEGTGGKKLRSIPVKELKGISPKELKTQRPRELKLHDPDESD